MPVIDTTVCVIGAGATGLALARRLSLAGLHCVIIDRSHAGSGSTCNSAGVLHSGARYALTDVALAKRCAQASTRIIALAPFAVNLANRAYYVVRDSDEDAYASRLGVACDSLGIETTRLSVNDSSCVEPMLFRSVRSVVTVPDYVIDPFYLVSAYVEAINDMGIQLISNAELDGVDRSDSFWTVRVHTPLDNETVSVRSQLIVLATGAWTPLLARHFGVEIRAQYANGSMLVLRDPIVKRIVSVCGKPSSGDSVIPSQNTTLIGSTWTLQDTPEPVVPSINDVRQMCGAASRIVRMVLPATVETYSGVRVILPSDVYSQSPADRTVPRDYYLFDHLYSHGIDGLISIFGGKLTLHDEMASEAVSLILQKLGGETPLSPVPPLTPPVSRSLIHLGSRRVGVATCQT